MLELRRLIVVLLSLAAIVLGIFAIGLTGDVIRELAGGVIAAGLAILVAHL